MAKQKISITLDEETLKLVEAMLENKAFRNRSHLVEFILDKYLEKNKWD